MLFSLLPADVQPVNAVKSLLSFPTGKASGYRAVRSSAAEGLGLASILSESPTALLPEELRPRYDEGVGAFFIPGVQREPSESETELALGARGPFPISKVRGEYEAKLRVELCVCFVLCTLWCSVGAIVAWKSPTAGFVESAGLAFLTGVVGCSVHMLTCPHAFIRQLLESGAVGGCGVWRSKELQ